MIDSLKENDVQSSLTAVTGSLQKAYSEIFTALVPSMQTIANQLGELRAGPIGAEFAEYALIRNTSEGQKAYLMYFIRGEDGVWRNDGM